MHKRKAVLFIYLLLLSIGIELEFTSLYSIDFSTTEYKSFLFSITLLSIYIVPIVAITLYTSNSWNVKVFFFPLAIVSGIFIGGWLAAYGNEFGDVLLSFIIPNADIKETWSAALTAPFIEEFVKASIVFIIIYLVQLNDLKSLFIVGIGVGLGFQIVEDFSYILNESTNSLNFSIPQALIRSSSSLSSHWMFTGIFAVGMYCFIYKNTFSKKRTQIFWILFPIILHFLWNSPINAEICNFPIVSSFLSAIIIMIFIQVFEFVKDS